MKVTDFNERSFLIKQDANSVTKQNSVLDIRPITDIDESPRMLDENPFAGKD